MCVLFLEEDGSVLRHFLATTFGLLYDEERQGRRYGLEFPRNEDLLSFLRLHKSFFQGETPMAPHDSSTSFPSRWNVVLRSLQDSSTRIEMTIGWSSPADPDLSSHLRETDLVVLVSSAPPSAGEVFQKILKDQKLDGQGGAPLRGMVFEVKGHPCLRKFSSLGGAPVPVRPLPVGSKGVSRIDPALEACWEEMEKGAPPSEPRRPSGERRGFKNSGWLKDRRWWYGGGVALALVGALMVWSMPFSADSQYDLGMKYERAGNYAEAAKYFRQAADQGDTDVQYSLGRMYAEGFDVPKDAAEAEKWYRKAAEGYRKAAEQGDAAAQTNLGWMYQEGLGVAKNDAEAVKWYRKAAEQGDAAAQNNLGWMYQRGLGVPTDYVEAVKWYKEAAEQGNVTAQYRLGYMYANGMGVEKDKAEAEKWYQRGRGRSK